MVKISLLKCYKLVINECIVGKTHKNKVRRLRKKTSLSVPLIYRSVLKYELPEKNCFEFFASDDFNLC